MKSLANQFVLNLKKNCTHNKSEPRKPSILSMNRFPSSLRAYESLGIKGLLSPMNSHSLSNPRFSPFANPRFAPFVLNKAWKEEIGISDSFDVLKLARPKVGRDHLGLGIALNEGEPSGSRSRVRIDGASKSVSPSSGQPVGLGVEKKDV